MTKADCIRVNCPWISQRIDKPYSDYPTSTQCIYAFPTSSFCWNNVSTCCYLCKDQCYCKTVSLSLVPNENELSLYIKQRKLTTLLRNRMRRIEIK